MLQQTLCFKVLNISYMYTHSYEFKISIKLKINLFFLEPTISFFKHLKNKYMYKQSNNS